MIEMPEAVVLAKQIKETLARKTIEKVIVGQSPHAFAWYYGNPQEYAEMLIGKMVNDSRSFGGLVEVIVEEMRLVFGDGVNLRYYEKESLLPVKHQLLIGFTDLTYLVGSIQMYGGILCYKEGCFDYKYYQIAKNSISPLTEDFSFSYFMSILDGLENKKMSLKAFLATEQRIPGLGNGVLQDILFKARLHPKRKINDLSETELQRLYQSIKDTLKEMIDFGGRDTEKDLFGNSGEYCTKLSKKTVNKPCPNCDHTITKESYMGGAIYFCTHCQE